MRSKIYHLTLLLLLFAVSGSFAQVVKFEKVYGGSGYDYGYSVTQTYDKGYVVVGATSSFGSGNMDAYLIKVDSMGNPKLHRTFGGINIDQAYSVQETKDTGLIVAGYTNSFGHGGYDMYLVKTNLYCDTIWTRTYGGSNWDFAYSAQQTADSGYVIAGGTYSFGHGNEDMYLVKTNANGDTTWTKTFGGTSDEEARSVKQTSDGGYILTGFTKSFGDVNGDIYTVKTDSGGNVMWTYKYPGAMADASYDVVECPGKFVIVGKTKSSGAGNYDGIVLQLSLTGAYIYDAPYGGSSEDGLNSVAYTPDGRIAYMGYTYSFGGGLGTDDYLLYIENPFNGFHSATYGGPKMEQAYCIKNTADGGYIICGTGASFSSAAAYSTLDHIYLIKADSNGVASGIVSGVLAGITTISAAGKDFNVYPNPSSDVLFIESDELKNSRVSIIDVLGKELYSVKETEEKAEINTAEFPNGIYFISIENKGIRSTKRIVVQH